MAPFFVYGCFGYSLFTPNNKTMNTEEFRKFVLSSAARKISSNSWFVMPYHGGSVF